MLYFNYKGRFFANMFQLIMRKNKSELPDEIVDNLMKIHSIHNDKYAPIGNAICDYWYDYYSEIVKWIVKFTNGYYVSQIVKKYLLTNYTKMSVHCLQDHKSLRHSNMF